MKFYFETEKELNEIKALYCFKGQRNNIVVLMNTNAEIRDGVWIDIHTVIIR